VCVCVWGGGGGGGILVEGEEIVKSDRLAGCDLRYVSMFVECCSVLQCVAVCCIVQQSVAVCFSVLQCVAVCCSVLQCVGCVGVC